MCECYGVDCGRDGDDCGRFPPSKPTAPDTLLVEKKWIHELERLLDDEFERICSWDRQHYEDEDRRETAHFLNEVRIKLGMPTIDVEAEIQA